MEFGSGAAEARCASGSAAPHPTTIMPLCYAMPHLNTERETELVKGVKIGTVAKLNQKNNDAEA